MARDPQLPSFPPRYKVLRTLGRGGMGIVHEAMDQVEGHAVALKTLHATAQEEGGGPAAGDGADLRRFEREIRALSFLRHEGIVRLHDVGRWDGRTYFTMEILEGVPLQAFLSRPLPGGDEIRWLLQVGLKVLEALDYLHRAGFVHRDLKPSNIMVLSGESGGQSDEPETSETSTKSPRSAEDSTVEDLLRSHDLRVKLLDFGLVKPREAELLGRRPAPGTPLYMAPEQMDPAAPSDPRSDLYSVGVILYQLVTRRLPHPSVASALSGKPPDPPGTLNPSCPPQLSSAILRLLEPRVHRRFGSALEAARPLREALGAENGAAATPRLLPPAFVPRPEVEEALEQALSAAAAGRGSVLAVSGARGTGKTWLLDRSGLKTRAVLELGLAYMEGRYAAGGALHQGLREVVLGLLLDLGRELGPEPLRGLLGPWGGELLDALGISSLPEVRSLWPSPQGPAPPEVLHDRVLQAGAALLRGAALKRPRLVILDDLHLADDLDIEILSRVSRPVASLASLPLLIIATYRPESLEGSPALRRWLAAEPEEGARAVRNLHLSPFSDGEACQMVRSMLSPQGEVAPALVGEVLDRTGGLPRALEECLGDLWSRGGLQLVTGEWKLAQHALAAGAAPPAEVDPVEGLDPCQRDIALAGAVLGETFELELLLGVLSPGDSANRQGRPEPAAPAAEEARRPRADEEVVAHLHALVGRGLLSRLPEGYAFARAGLRDRLGALLEPARQRELHRRAAEALLALRQEAAGDHWEAAACHCVAAGLPERALELYLRAARRAAQHYSNRRGIASYRAALGLTAPEERAAIACELGRLHARIGEFAAALDCYRSALDGGQSPSFAVLDEMGRVHQRRGEFRAARDCFERALALAGSDPELVMRARYRLGGVRFDEGDLPGSAEDYRSGLVIASSRGDPGTMAMAHLGLGLVEKRREALQAAAEHFQEAIHLAEKAGRLDQAANALNNLGNIRRARGEDQEARECFRRSMTLRERIGDRTGLAICLNNLARVEARRGRLEEAAGCARRALRIFDEVGDSKGVLIASGNLGAFLLLRGDFSAARPLLLRARALAERTGDRRALADVLHCLGKVENSRGEAGEGQRHLREALRLLAEEQGDHDLHAGLLAELARSRLAGGDLEGAQDAVREGLEAVEAAGGQVPAGELRSPLLTAASELELARGDPRAAVERARGALEPLLDAGPRFEAAQAHRQLGRSYRELGPDWVDRSEKHLNAALSLFEQMGAQLEAALTLLETGDLWLSLEEEAAAEHAYRHAEETLGPLDAPRRLEEVRERLRLVRGGRR